MNSVLNDEINQKEGFDMRCKDCKFHHDGWCENICAEVEELLPACDEAEENEELKELDIREVLELLKLRRADAWGEGEPYIEIDINEADAIIKALQSH